MEERAREGRMDARVARVVGDGGRRDRWCSTARAV